MTDAPAGPGPWNPGIQSHIPQELLHLCTIFRPENVFTSLAAVTELQGLTGFSPSELVAFRPQRLALHELLIRVTADFSVPDGSRIEDLGINFREIANRVLVNHLVPQMDAIAAGYDEVRRQLTHAISAALVGVVPGLAPVPAAVPRESRSGLLSLFARRRRAVAGPPSDRGWGPDQIAACQRIAHSAGDAMQRSVYRALARVMSGLFLTHGHPWGTRELIVSLATDLACNDYGSDAVGLSIEPLLLRAARNEGYRRLPRQERPVVINTKGPSAAGKSTLRPLQRKLAGEIGLNWNEFALISPDIWRKQLLDYEALGTAYKYAGAFSADELEIVDQKLDRYMAGKYRRGEMTHLLIDRFRFESVAPDSSEAGSNLLTRFGHTVYLFFLIAPPESLVERAWKRGLDVGRYKAVDDTLAHAVEAYGGMPDVFFTWVRRSDKRIHFEFLDNSVRFGERPRTVAFGDNDTINLLDLGCLLNIERYRRVNVDATEPRRLYQNPQLLEADHNMAFLRSCVDGFRTVNFARQATGRIYLRIDAGRPVLIDEAALREALADPDTMASLRAVAPRALTGNLPAADRPLYLGAEAGVPQAPTLGQWGSANRERG